MDIEQLYKLYLASTNICTDTRKINKGCLFFALKGDNFDANRFANEAIQKGASYAVIDNAKFKTEQTILVDNVLNTLQSLAQHHRKTLGIPIIALTGSNGKTTTKELINAVLSTQFRTSATSGNLNNHIGVPLTILAMNQDTEIGIVEMGANHHKEIAELSNIALPDYGYITNFGKAHLEGFGSLEGVIEAKTELYEHIKQYDKTLFINADDPIQKSKSEGINRIEFGNKQSINIKYHSANPHVYAGFDGRLIKSNLIGAYNYGNIAAAIAIGHYFSVSSKLIQEAIANYIPTNNRSQMMIKGSNKIILDAYNANPTSMKAALDNFDQLPDRHKVVICGDMFELGEIADQEHQAIADQLNLMDLTQGILIGEIFNRTQSGKLKKFNSFEEFENYWKSQDFKETTFLIKASRGMALERIVDFFDA